MIPGCGSPFVFPIRILDKQNLSVDKCMNILGEKGVEIRSLMGGTITEQPAYRHIPTDSLSNCLEISKEVRFILLKKINNLLIVFLNLTVFFYWCTSNFK